MRAKLIHLFKDESVVDRMLEQAILLRKQMGRKWVFDHVLCPPFEAVSRKRPSISAESARLRSRLGAVWMCGPSSGADELLRSAIGPTSTRA